MNMHGMPMPGMNMGGPAAGMSGWGYGALVLLGAFHGINPAMGWLFAVWGVCKFERGERWSRRSPRSHSGTLHRTTTC